jgi:acyl carrier protein
MQDELAERLVKCFKHVFPAMNTADIPAATQETTGAWDSVAHVTLLSLIGEEFGIDIDFEEFAEATSFAAILNLVRARV